MGVISGLVGQHVFLWSVANPQSRPLLIVHLSLTSSLLLAPRPVGLQLPLSVQLLSASLPKLQEIHPAAVQTTHEHFPESLPENDKSQICGGPNPIPNTTSILNCLNL